MNVSLQDHSKNPAGPVYSKDIMKNSLVYRTLFNDDRKELYNLVRDFAKRELVPRTIKLHKGEAKFKRHHGDVKPEEIVDLDEFRGIGVPEKYGGFDVWAGIVDLVILHQNLAYGSASAAAFYDGHGLFVGPLLLAGTDAQKAFYIPKMVSGDWTGCYGLTDLNCGSDVAHMTTLQYEKQGGLYLLKGAKTFVTNGPIADHAVVFSKESGNDSAYKNITAFIVPAAKDGAPGFVAEKPMDKLGWRASDTSIISMDSVAVPHENILGEEGQGFKIAVTTLEYGRLKVAAEALGLMERDYDELVAFAQERPAYGGGKLKNAPVFQKQLAIIAQKIQATRDMIYNAAFLAESRTDDGKVPPFSDQAANAKSLAGKNLQEVADLAVQLHGGYGFTYEYPVSVIACDKHLYMIGEGADNPLTISTGAALLGK